jgi:hypothetical protein
MIQTHLLVREGITARVQLKKISLVVRLKGLDAKRN